jgi:hypothetical protein
MDRKTRVTTGLLLVAAVMVYGTWLAVDDMRAKPLAAAVRLQPGIVHLDNTGDYAWQELRLTLNGRFTATVPGPVPAGRGVDAELAAFRDAGDQPLDWNRETLRELAVTVTRVPRFPLMNRGRTASGTFALE